MTARSYSQVSLYEKCPRQYKLRYIDRFTTDRPKSEAASRGTRIHQPVEDFMLGNRPDVDEEIQHYQDWFTEIKDGNAQPELQFCLDEGWEPAEWDSELGHIRGYIDLLYTEGDEATVYEFKTGRKYPEHESQMELYSTVVLSLQPEFEKVTAIALYLDQKDTLEIEYTRDRHGSRKYLWSSRINRISKDQHFAARPGLHCRWCDFAKSNSGPCEFGG